jgi:hypothetical protein
MSRTWTELDHLERRNGLSFLRDPDPGFVWAAYRWVRGAKLEDVLDSVPGLTPGDFVRSMKQLIDLLDQIAVASRAGDPPAARAGGSARPDEGPAGAAASGGAAASDPEASDPEADDPEAGRVAALDPGTDVAAGERPSREPPPKARDVAATARAAIDAMRRGVIAYTALTD